MAGIKLHPYAEWFIQGRSLCAGASLEAPYLGPAVFSIREEEIPDIGLPLKYELLDARVCKDGITAIGYVYQGAFVVLADGPREWPVRAPEELISAGTVADRPAVLVAPVRPGEAEFSGAMVIVAEEFGLTVVTRTPSLEEAVEIAAAVPRERITIPRGKEPFSSVLNGIRFYTGLHNDNRREGCAWGSYGLEDPRRAPVDIAKDSPLDVLPSYLAEGYSLDAKTGTSCGGPIDLVEADFKGPSDVIDLGIFRLSGEPAWWSPFSEDWLTAGTIAGRPAVFIAPPDWLRRETEPFIQVIVKEDFGLTVVSGQVPLEEAKRVAEGLNR